MTSIFRPVMVLAAFTSLIATAASAQADEKRYLRYVEEGRTQKLETSVVRFENANGVKVDLIGAVHVGDASYYEQLNTRFKTYDAVLYEMVKPREMKRVAERRDSDSWISLLQRFMKSQLDLTFQLDKIDYDATNFVHADLDAETFVQKQAERGENMLTLMINSMLKEMNRPADSKPASDQPVVGIMDLINALQAPDRPRQLKLVMAKQFENMDEALDAMGGDDSVILGERNKEALKVLREQIDAGKKNLAIFYGAGHMKGMEELMTALMGFKPVGEPEWITAWDMSEGAAAATPATQPAGAGR